MSRSLVARIASLAALVAMAVLSTSAMATPPGLVQGRIVDYVKPPGSPGGGGGGGGGTAGTAMATDFKLAKQHWTTSAVDYVVNPTDCGATSSGCRSAVDAGFDAWQPTSHVSFNDNSGTSQDNPCTPGTPNTVEWVTIDGPGATLAQTLPCIYLGTNRMAGFIIQFDKDDAWSTCGPSCPSTVFPIQATATHEAGHAVGLNHVGSPRDTRLTMYPYITPGDFGFATLGCGDQLGTAQQYGTSFTCTAGTTVPVD